MTRLQGEERSLEAAIDPVTALVTQTGQADSDPGGQVEQRRSIHRRPTTKASTPDRHVGTTAREPDGTRPRVGVLEANLTPALTRPFSGLMPLTAQVTGAAGQACRSRQPSPAPGAWPPPLAGTSSIASGWPLSAAPRLTATSPRCWTTTSRPSGPVAPPTGRRPDQEATGSSLPNVVIWRKLGTGNCTFARRRGRDPVPMGCWSARSVS